jgi:hypothetical protein
MASHIDNPDVVLIGSGVMSPNQPIVLQENAEEAEQPQSDSFNNLRYLCSLL